MCLFKEAYKTFRVAMYTFKIDYVFKFMYKSLIIVQVIIFISNVFEWRKNNLVYIWIYKNHNII